MKRPWGATVWTSLIPDSVWRWVTQGCLWNAWNSTTSCWPTVKKTKINSKITLPHMIYEPLIQSEFNWLARVWLQVIAVHGRKCSCVWPQQCWTTRLSVSLPESLPFFSSVHPVNWPQWALLIHGNWIPQISSQPVRRLCSGHLCPQWHGKKKIYPARAVKYSKTKSCFISNKRMFDICNLPPLPVLTCDGCSVFDHRNYSLEKIWISWNKRQRLSLAR